MAFANSSGLIPICIFLQAHMVSYCLMYWTLVWQSAQSLKKVQMNQSLVNFHLSIEDNPTISVYLSTMKGMASLGVQPKPIQPVMNTLEEGDTTVIALQICVLSFMTTKSLSNGRIKTQWVSIWYLLYVPRISAKHWHKTLICVLQVHTFVLLGHKSKLF